MNTFLNKLFVSTCVGLNAVSQRPKGVVSMSLGGGANHALDAGVQALIDTGYVLSIAAGNSDSDACYNSPARVPDVSFISRSENTVVVDGCVRLASPGQPRSVPGIRSNSFDVIPGAHPGQPLVPVLWNGSLGAGPRCTRRGVIVRLSLQGLTRMSTTGSTKGS